MNQPSLFKYSESRLAIALALSRTDLKLLRDTKLVVDLDWTKHGGTDVVLSQSGLKKIRRFTGPWPRDFDLRDCLVAQKKNGAAAIPLGDILQPIPEKMRCTHICPNPSVVLAIDQHGRRQSVWVGRNVNFVVGMQLVVVPHAGMPGWWRLVGPVPQRRYTVDEWNRRQQAFGGRI